MGLEFGVVASWRLTLSQTDMVALNSTTLKDPAFDKPLQLSDYAAKQFAQL
jgi:hypothetical protein